MVLVWFGVNWTLGEAFATAVGHRLLLPQLTVTVKLQTAVLPEASLAVQVTVVVPHGKVLPEGGTQLKLARPHASVALAT